MGTQTRLAGHLFIGGIKGGTGAKGQASLPTRDWLAVGQTLPPMLRSPGPRPVRFDPGEKGSLVVLGWAGPSGSCFFTKRRTSYSF